MPRLIAFNKPFDVLCQFRPVAGRRTLADFIQLPDVHAAGRLDRDSEGLLLLTDHGPWQHRIAHPGYKLPKTYWVQVERVPDEEAIERLRGGVELNDGRTLPAGVRRLEEPPLWQRDPPIRHRLNVPTCWLEIVLSEGRNRQVRRMTAAVGHPTLRLVRHAVGPFSVDGLAPGRWREVDPGGIFATVRRSEPPRRGGPPGPRRRPRNRRERP